MRFFPLSLLLLAVSGMAAAQTTGTTTGTSTASNNVNVVAVSNPNPASSDSRVTYDGHTYTTPSVQGGYFAGANPCLVGVGAGGAGGPIGFNLTLGRSDQGCTRRSDAAAWHALGYDDIAIARMCQDQANADAFFSSTGRACPGTGSNGRYKTAEGAAAPEARLVRVTSAAPPPRANIASDADVVDPAATPLPNPAVGPNAIPPR